MSTPIRQTRSSRTVEAPELAAHAVLARHQRKELPPLHRLVRVNHAAPGAAQVLRLLLRPDLLLRRRLPACSHLCRPGRILRLLGGGGLGRLARLLRRLRRLPRLLLRAKCLHLLGRAPLALALPPDGELFLLLVTAVDLDVPCALLLSTGVSCRQFKV